MRILRDQFTPLEVTPESLAFDAHDEVRQGGHFLGVAHTMERFRDCFYRPLVLTTENFERWTRNGSADTATRATGIYQELLAAYEEPALDAGSARSWTRTSSVGPASSATEL